MSARTQRYAELAAHGMTARQIADECGTLPKNVRSWAARHGVKLSPGSHMSGASQVLSLLAPWERADYDILKRMSYTRIEALIAIGRADLIKEERT